MRQGIAFLDVDLGETLRRRTDEMRRRLAAFQEWRTDLTAELRVLPQTLADFREGVANFQTVSKRLVSGTEGIERLNDMYSTGVGDSVHRLGEAAAALQRQLDPIRSRAEPDVRKAVEDLTHNLAALAELNPFWPRRGGGGSGTKR